MQLRQIGDTDHRTQNNLFQIATPCNRNALHKQYRIHCLLSLAMSYVNDISFLTILNNNGYRLLQYH